MLDVDIARVAVNGVRYDIDILYDYLIPKGMTPQVKVGTRVMIPFGRGNRHHEGVVLAIAQGEMYRGLKPILQVLDETPVLDDKALALAQWMKRRYFCTLYDAIHAILPPQLWYETQEFWSLTETWRDSEAVIRSWEGGDAVLDTLLANQGRAGRDALRDVCDNWRAVLRQLYSIGAADCEVKIKSRAPRRVNAAERMIELTLPAEEALTMADGFRLRAPLRYEVVRLLAASGKLAVSEARYFSGASPYVLREMEKIGLIQFSEIEPPPAEVPASDAPAFTLNEEQQRAFETIADLMEREEPNVVLLRGVTGSGKTQVYLRLTRKALEMGKSAMILVPEIILTPQLMGKFRAAFGDSVALLHSGLKLSERYEQWRRVRDGAARVVLGTRSAVFAPLPNLALVILDEEQESSYDSQNPPRYHTRDVAKYLCARECATLVLGSATPSVETAWAADAGRYHLAALRHRYNQKRMPDVLISDLRNELRAGNDGLIGQDLRRELSANLERGEQSILFLNRRGSYRMLLCMECGHVPECPRCSVPMTYHAANDRMMCHYCGHSERGMHECPTCGGMMKRIGAGTQTVEEELRGLFPGAEVLRMDADTATGKQSQLLEKFEKERVPILLGTQMVARGLDFENVTLVGALFAEQSLYQDHYRAAERTFSLLTQVVGRAGRGQRQGRAVLQTYQPDSDLIRAAAAQNYDDFYQTEIKLRALRRYPPFADIFTLTVSGWDSDSAFRMGLKIRDTLRNLFFRSEFAAMRPEIFGPAPAQILRVDTRYRYRVLLAAQNQAPVRERLRWLLREFYRDPAARKLLLSVECNGDA